MQRHTKILLGLLAGVILGLIAHKLGPNAAFIDGVVKNVANPLGQLFLRLIFMIVVPLVFSSLVLGVLELGDIRRIGRIGLRTLGYTVVASGLSVLIGVGLVNLVKPGAGVDPGVRTELTSTFASGSKVAIENAAKAKHWTESLLSLIPRNPLAAAVDAFSGEMIALMVFALMFGVALSMVRDESTEPFVGVMQAMQRASMKIVDWAMTLAPLGVAALMFAMTAKSGFDLIPRLGKYVAVVVVGLGIQLIVVYGIILRASGVSPVTWFKRCEEVFLTAFSTASSNATLPTTLRTSEEKLGIPPRIGSFVLTVGATGNQNGTALFEGVTVLFLAQVFGVSLTFGQQVTVVFMSILAGIGTAGIPGGSLPLIVLVLQSVGVPAEGIGIILGVDRFLDMCRTVLNVIGDLVCATFVAKSEGELHFAEKTGA
jgi:dicarboxylate/amino acid:cation (Na+ or H+) symporter, DAACS family